MSSVHALLFDLDGTLVDTLPDITTAANHALQHLGRAPVSAERVRRLVGRGAANLLMHLLELQDPSNPLVQAGVACFLDEYERHPSRHARLYPGIVELLTTFSQLPKLVITNKNTHIARLTLEHLGISTAFQGIYGSDAFAQKKPHPLPLLEGARLLELSPAHLVMIGDSRFDVEAGHAAGMRTLAVSWGFEDRKVLEALHPTALFDHPSRLSQWIRQEMASHRS
ncbi:MAG: HAD family hydrolase [Myxococcota bacterium]